MLNRNYGRLRDDARIIYAPSEVKIGNTYYPAPTAEQYAACGYLPIDSTKPEKEGSYFISTEYGDYFISTEYGDLVDGRIVRRYDERPIVAPPPPVIRYSGWKMYKAIKAEGFGEAFDALMKAVIGVMIAFVRPQYFLSDDDDFTSMVAKLCTALGIDDETKERILAASVDEEVGV